MTISAARVPGGPRRTGPVVSSVARSIAPTLGSKNCGAGPAGSAKLATTRNEIALRSGATE